MEIEQNNSRNNKKDQEKSSIFVYSTSQHQWYIGQQVHINTGYQCNQVSKYSYMERTGDRKYASEKRREATLPYP